MSSTDRHRYKFIGCEIIYREACYLAATGPNMVDVEFLLKGLHDLPRQDMLAKLQATVDAARPDAGYEAILLGYARCNDGLVGLAARQIPLVIPRAHDCITLFFGSRANYKDYFDNHPGTYYLSSGWSERNIGWSRQDGGYTTPAYGRKGVMANLGLTEPYEDMVAKYGKENADFIIESLGGWEKAYSHSLYLKMGACEEGDYIEKGRQDATNRGWDFNVQDGDWTLLEKLFMGRWDDDFLIVKPGQHIVARNDELVLGASD